MFVKTFLNNYVSWLKFEIPHCIPLKFCNVFFKDLICIFPYVACSTSPFYKNHAEKNGIVTLEGHISELETMYSDCSCLADG